MKLTDFELGWLVGLLEGEGGFQFGGGSQTVRLEMTDADVVAKAVDLIYKLTGFKTTIRYQHRGNEDHSATYIISISGRHAQTIMRTIVSHMGYRRRQRIWQVLNKVAPDRSVTVNSVLKLVIGNG